ncbi:MAG: hypothetical protein NZ518_04630 [Dehalococcoidia bacterium]|nr:hypothetical protein [Dehalococcoidia bacterium]
MARVGVIDIGSNTVHLLIAETDGVTMTTLADPSVALFLGQDVARTGQIAPQRIPQIVAVVVGFYEQAKAAGATQTLALATAAIRAASNGKEVIDAIRAAAAPIELISSRREGELAYLGTTLDTPQHGPSLVMDIGGGSAQLVLVERRVPTVVLSVPLGSGVLAATWPGDPPGAVATAQLGSRIGATLEQAFAESGILGVARHVVGVGGTIRRLGRLAARASPPVTVSRAALADTVDSLFLAPAAVVSRRLGLDAARVGTLRAGGLVLMDALHRLGASTLSVSACGIREGAALLLGRGVDPVAEDIFHARHAEDATVPTPSRSPAR